LHQEVEVHNILRSGMMYTHASRVLVCLGCEESCVSVSYAPAWTSATMVVRSVSLAQPVPSLQILLRM
ncbi:hypothetical protein CSUI_008964, partial [Cystoisospora suis]